MKLNLFVLLALCFTLNANAKKKVTLRYNLDKGDQYEMIMNMDQNMEMQAQGQSIEMKMSMKFFMSLEVTADKSTEYDLEYTITRVTMKNQMMGMNVAYDSAEEADESNPMTQQMAAAFKNIIDKSFLVTMNNRGQMISMDVSLFPKNEILENMKTGNQFAVYPENPVSIGDSWTAEIGQDKLMGMNMTANYSLEEIEGNNAKLKFNGKISADEIAGKSISMNGDQRGDLIVDLSSGMATESIISQNLGMTVSEGEQTVPTKIKGTYTITMEKK